MFSSRINHAHYQIQIVKHVQKKCRRDFSIIILYYLERSFYCFFICNIQDCRRYSSLENSRISNCDIRIVLREAMKTNEALYFQCYFHNSLGKEERLFSRWTDSALHLPSGLIASAYMYITLLFYLFMLYIFYQLDLFIQDITLYSQINNNSNNSEILCQRRQWKCLRSKTQ